MEERSEQFGLSFPRWDIEGLLDPCPLCNSFHSSQPRSTRSYCRFQEIEDRTEQLLLSCPCWDVEGFSDPCPVCHSLKRSRINFISHPNKRLRLSSSISTTTTSFHATKPRSILRKMTGSFDRNRPKKKVHFQVVPVVNFYSDVQDGSGQLSDPVQEIPIV